MGYYDALKVINKLKGNNYYIKDIKPGIFFESLLKLSDDQILDIAEGCIKVNKEKEARKVLFENILPDISKRLKLSKALSYNDLLIEIAEYLVASEELVEKYEVHELKDVILEIKKNSSRMLRKERMSLVRNTAKEMAIKLIKEIDIENM